MAPARTRTLAAAAAAIVALGPLAARADEGDKPPKEGTSQAPPPPPQPAAPRRGSFMAGISLGAGVASIVGYPNDLTKIGYASGYTATGARPAGALSAWLGTAFSEWFTFGAGVSMSGLVATGDDRAWLLAGVFRVDTFPLFALGGAWRDLGIRIDAGLGTATVTNPAGDKLVDGSFASLVGGGVFWEGIRARKTRHGPMIYGDYLWSDTARRPAIFLGWRSVLYAKP
jgi:hypothetical protein